MATSTQQSAVRPGAVEEPFYSAYRWCLNPMLSLRELLQHLGEEIEAYRANGAAGWQGEERRINLYLFSCAIACTLDDYLAARRWNLSSLGRRLPRALPAVKAVDTVLNAPYALVSRSAVARARAWRR
jgi:hypothetical protein